MALERIDPFSREDRFCLDHLLRYTWIQPLMAKQKVLDIACGSGFGTGMIAEADAAEVIGVDRDEATITQCRELWKSPRIRFETGLIEELLSMGLGTVDRVVCFETLEHVADPAQALQAIHAVLGESGILIGSVPGETDWTEENEFHLQQFNHDSLAALLGKSFRHVRLFRQRFHLGSLIEAENQGTGEVVRVEERSQMRLDFGHAPDWADTWLFLASDAEIPDVPGVPFALSRQAWLNYVSDSGKAAGELKRIMARFRELFFLHGDLKRQHGDLKRRFANMLGWGKYHYQLAHGKEPEEDFLLRLEQTQSDRERELHREVEQLREEVDQLRKEVLQAHQDRETMARAATAGERRDRFMEGLKS